MHFLGCPNLERRAALSLSNLLDITLVIIFAVKSFLAAVLRPRRGANQRVSPLFASGYKVVLPAEKSAAPPCL